MGCKNALTGFDKGNIVAFKVQGLSATAIAKKNKRSTGVILKYFSVARRIMELINLQDVRQI